MLAESTLVAQDFEVVLGAEIFVVVLRGILSVEVQREELR